MTFTYNPKGVCARQFTIEVEEGKVANISVVGGCSGNLQGIAALLKGMSVEDAILQMELLGHSFFVFVNVETDRTNVLYLRKDGDLGLMEPEA